MAHRPLSPHLQIYQLPFAAILSITHRVTGVFLTLGSVLLVYWLVAIASGETADPASTSATGLVVWIAGPVFMLVCLVFPPL